MYIFPINEYENLNWGGNPAREIKKYNLETNTWEGV